MQQKNIDDDDLKGDNFWVPSLSQLKDKGIEYHVWTQNPGDISYTGPGTPHWVLNPVSKYFILFYFIRMEAPISLGMSCSWETNM
jgi:hypothetical protein